MFRYLRRVITHFRSHIHFKIILPFAVLTLVVAVTGAYFSSRLVSGSLEERFTRQLIEAASATADGLVRQERDQLEQLRAISFTDGLDEAVFAADYRKLQTLLFPLVANYGIDRVDVLDVSGRQLLEIQRPRGATNVEDYSVRKGVSVDDWPIQPTVQRVLNGVVDAEGDKYVELASLSDNELFLTMGPIKQGDEIVGMVLVSSYLSDLLRSLAKGTFADVTVYSLDGSVVATSLAVDQADLEALSIIESEARSILAVDGKSSLRRTVVLGGREYALLFGILRARAKPLGFYSVALQTTPLVAFRTEARNQMVLIFTGMLLLVFGIGYLTANAIAGRLRYLMTNALAVASGDFTRRTHISSSDEIGSLARSIDHMTDSLANYTDALQDRIDELVALHDSSTAVTVKSGLNLDQTLHAVASSAKKVTKSNGEVVVYLMSKDEQELVPRAAAQGGLGPFPVLPYAGNAGMKALLENAGPQIIRQPEIESLALSAFSKRGVSHIIFVPLRVGLELIGMLVLVPEPAFRHPLLLNEDNNHLLGTLANQAAIAVKNAQLFEETRRAYEELQQVDNLKTEFINIAAHELRTPLGAMMAYASFIEKRSPPKLHRSMRFLVASTLRMRTMIDAMLAVQGLDTGTIFLRLTPVDLGYLINKVAGDFELMAELEGHIIEVDVPDDLSPVQLDAEKVSLILSNLLSNAIKFTAGEGRIEIIARDYKKGVLISVRDNGVGIAAEDQDRIFERFFQTAASHIAGHGGMGIGLTIVKRLVELHDGQVWVESGSDKGSTFKFTLPYPDVDEQETAPTTTSVEIHEMKEQVTVAEML